MNLPAHGDFPKKETQAFCATLDKRCRKSKRQRRAGFVDVAEWIDGEGEDDERSDENKCTTYSAKFLPIEVKEYVPESNPTEEYTGEKKIQIEGTAAEGLAE